jgi:hypothetical protein
MRLPTPPSCISIGIKLYSYISSPLHSAFYPRSPRRHLPSTPEMLRWHSACIFGTSLWTWSLQLPDGRSFGGSRGVFFAYLDVLLLGLLALRPLLNFQKAQRYSSSTLSPAVLVRSGSRSLIRSGRFIFCGSQALAAMRHQYQGYQGSRSRDDNIVSLELRIFNRA